MRLISRHLLRSHIAPFILGSLTVVFLFFFQFLILNLDKLIGKGLDNLTILQLISYQMPAFIVLAIPMGVLFSTIMAFGSMSANHEITIIKSSGGSLLSMMFPVLIVSAGITLFNFWLNNEVLPDSNHASKLLLSDIQQKKPTFALENGQFSTQLDGFTILPRDIDSSRGLMRALTIYDNRDAIRKSIITADSGYIRFDRKSEKMVMDLFYGEIIQYSENKVTNQQKIDFDTYRMFIETSGFNLNRSTGSDDTRGDRELKIADMQKRVDKSISNEWNLRRNVNKRISEHINYITKYHKPEEEETNKPEVLKPMFGTRQSKDVAESNVVYDTLEQDMANSVPFAEDPTTTGYGRGNIQTELLNLYNAVFIDIQMVRSRQDEQKAYLVEIHKKYAIPFACIVFALVGCPLGIRTRGGNFGLSAAFSLGFFILYWACLIAGEKFADRGLLAPWLGMWMGNIIVGTMGIIMTFKVNNDNLRIIKVIKSWLIPVKKPQAIES